MSTLQTKNIKLSKGYLLVLVLVFGAMFTLVISSFVGYIVTQNNLVNFRFEQQRATEIAEAGLNYYKWYLAHYPGDSTNGTGLPGPYVHVYEDPEDGPIGEFSLSIASSSYCGDVASIDITSTGHTYVDPSAVAVVSGRYSRPTVASYSFVTNSGVWYGPTSVTNGPIHSNQGIRMEAAHNSVVSSGQADWLCNSSYGCSPSATVDGVYTTSGNANPSLFSFPVAPINFAGITLDLADIQNKAEFGGGLYFGPSGKSGYHVIFRAGNQVEVRRVNSKQNEPNGYAWGRYMNILKGTSLVGIYDIDPACPVIFVEDQVWLEGEVAGKVTIAAADIDSVGVDPSIILNDNITYSTANAGLLAVAEYDMLIGLVVPDDMELNGIFVAQTGHFGRNYYNTSMPNAWEQYIIRNSLTMNGTIVSNNRAGYNWVYSNGNLASGFTSSASSYDVSQIYNSPPYTPITSDVYTFFNWRQDG